MTLWALGHAPTGPELATMFAGQGASVETSPLVDFSRSKQGAVPFCQVIPRSAQQVCDVVAIAHEHDIPLRIRGNGHALNGASLPLPGELVVRTDRLSDIRFEEHGTVTAGAGIPMWDLDQGLRSTGYCLPVINDGYSGPTVGGFIAAGGFGSRSAQYGGFWQNVRELHVASAAGVVRIGRFDHTFPWYFGAMGQLGIVVGAVLDIVIEEPGTPVRYPRGSSLTPAQVSPLQGHTGTQPLDEVGTKLYWFTLFASPTRRDDALARLEKLQHTHHATFRYREQYCYHIRDCSGTIAPLVFPDGGSFYAVGIWGFHEDDSSAGRARVTRFETDFMRTAMRGGHRRYIQSELPCGTRVYGDYFGADSLSAFRAIKQRTDPRSLFNRGWLFEVPHSL